MTRTERARNRAVDAIMRLLDGGTLVVVDEAGIVLAELGFQRPAADGPASKGRARANGLTSDLNVSAGAPAAWHARTVDGDMVLYGPVSDIGLPKGTVFQGGATLAVQEFIYEERA